MRQFVVETLIPAPREVVFDRVRDVGAHIVRVVPPGRTSGLLEAGDTATFAGILGRFTIHVIELERPVRRVDDATHPAFRTLRHVHEFFEADGGTLMHDTLEYESSFGAIAGWFLRRFVRRRASALHFEIR